MPTSGRSPQSGTVRVATLDVQHSYRRSAVVLGPVDVPPLDVLTARFAAMTAAGPEARIGLQPSTTSTRWQHTPGLIGEVFATTTRPPGFSRGLGDISPNSMTPCSTPKRWAPHWIQSPNRRLCCFARARRYLAAPGSR